MPDLPHDGLGRRIAYYRGVVRPKMTQQRLAEVACVSLGTVRKIERGERGVTDATLEAIAGALGVDPGRLRADRGPVQSAVQKALPALSAAIAAYDVPDDGPVRALPELRTAVFEAERWRLAAQYTRIVRHVPELLAELARGYHRAGMDERCELARLLVSAYRSADSVAFKFGARDLSARLVELMRWAVPEAEDPLLTASVAYVRTETFFAAHAYASGLRALEQALDAAPAPGEPLEIAMKGTLHMRAAVIAGRAGDVPAARSHLAHARLLADQISEGVYYGTAFGPDSVRIHEVSVAVSLGAEHVGLQVVRSGLPSLPVAGDPAHRATERRSAGGRRRDREGGPGRCRRGSPSSHRDREHGPDGRVREGQATGPRRRGPVRSLRCAQRGHDVSGLRSADRGLCGGGAVRRRRFFQWTEQSGLT
ncbi:MAG: helix-turn-helix transcriptional regulator [Streptomyces sp.]|nr:helix-turn-helix transcriptional regulator [Streptomyces sp.]NUT29625.1 helix-turn-helix transcriptional regulator [Streptomyces sp.]